MIITEMSTIERLEDHEIRSEYGSETLKYDIAAALVAARRMRNLTQVALANIAGVSQAYIAKLESGEANPTIGRIGAILASIWLKAEINFMPLISTFDAEIAQQRTTNQEANTILPTTHMNTTAHITFPEEIPSIPIAETAIMTPYNMDRARNLQLTRRENIFTRSNNVLALQT